MPTIDNQHDKNTPAPAEVLSLSFYCNDLGQDITVQGYFQRLLTELWREGENFSGKRPFGNSDWQWDVYTALIEAGHIPGKLEEDGYIEEFDKGRGAAFVIGLIWQMTHDATLRHLHCLAIEASRSNSTSSAGRHARDELVRVCLSLEGGEQ